MNSEAHDGELPVPELIWLLRTELPVEGLPLDVVDLSPLLHPGEKLHNAAHHGSVDACEGIPGWPIYVRKGLSVPIEDGDLVLPDDDVVVQPYVSRDVPHDVPALTLALPRKGLRPEETHLPTSVPEITSILLLNLSSKLSSRDLIFLACSGTCL